MTRDEAIEIAKRNAQFAAMLPNAPGYLKQANDPTFEPHEWIVQSILSAANPQPMAPAFNSFEAVSKMNEAFGNPKGDPASIDGKRLLSQCKNIGKEYEELMAAFGIKIEITYGERGSAVPVKGDPVDNIRDALCDIVVFALGGQHFMGYDGNNDMAEVVSALYSRFCRNVEHLEETCSHYDKLGIKYYVEGKFPTVCLKSLLDQGDGEYPKGKFLKALGYRKPSFYAPAPVAAQKKIDMRQPTQVATAADLKIYDKAAGIPIARKFMGQEPLPPAELAASVTATAQQIQSNILERLDAMEPVQSVDTFKGPTPEEISAAMDAMSKLREENMRKEKERAEIVRKSVRLFARILDQMTEEQFALYVANRAPVIIQPGLPGFDTKDPHE